MAVVTVTYLGRTEKLTMHKDRVVLMGDGYDLRRELLRMCAAPCDRPIDFDIVDLPAGTTIDLEVAVDREKLDGRHVGLIKVT